MDKLSPLLKRQMAWRTDSVYQESVLELYNIFTGMFEGNFQEEEVQIQNYSGYKAPLLTCNTLQRGSSMMSPNFNHLEGFANAVDLSIDGQLYRNNAILIREVVLSYLKHCLGQSIGQEDPITSGHIFCFPSFTALQSQGDSDLDVLVHENKLLNEWTKKIMLENFKEFHQLNGLFAELVERLGSGLSQEIVFVLFAILQRKVSAFKELVNKKETDWLIPKFDRFWSDGDVDNQTDSDFKAYGDLEPEEVKKFASKDVEQIAKSIYFSNEMKFLSLKEVKVEVKPTINVPDKFATLMIHISRAIFLTMAGMAIPDPDTEQFLSQLCLHTSKEGDVVGTEMTKRVKQ